MKIELSKEERKILCESILTQIQGFNDYKHNKFVNTGRIEKYQGKLRGLLNKLC